MFGLVIVTIEEYSSLPQLSACYIVFFDSRVNIYILVISHDG